MSVVAGAHATLANGRPAMALPVPVFHRRDRASFAWRTGSLGHAATPRFPSPLIERSMQISSTTLSDWFHRQAHGGGPRCTRESRSTPRSVPPSPYNTASSEGSGSFQAFPGSSPITLPRHRRKHTRSQGPSLHRRYPLRGAPHNGYSVLFIVPRSGTAASQELLI